MRATKAICSESASLRSRCTKRTIRVLRSTRVPIDRLEVIVADDQITLPMAGFRTISRRKRPVRDGEHRLARWGTSVTGNPPSWGNYVTADSHGAQTPP